MKIISSNLFELLLEMVSFLIILFLLVLSLGNALKLDLEYAINGKHYQPWCTATIEAPLDSTLKRKVTFSSQALSTDLKVNPSDLFYVQLQTSNGVISNSINVRNLVDSQWKIDVKFVIINEIVHSIELRTAKLSSQVSDSLEVVNLPSQLAIRGSVLVSEYSGVEVPAPKAAKGIPHVGQGEVSEAELLQRSKGGSFSSSDEALGTAHVGTSKQHSNENEPSFLMKYWHLLLPGLFFFFLSGREQQLKQQAQKKA